ncbi:MAG: hypothetical protein LAT57_04130 [Balneolales bacterium]|nr:hypothetical protein [Balneolales bacterium]
MNTIVNKLVLITLFVGFVFTSVFAQIPDGDAPVELREGGVLFQKPFQIAIDDLGWIQGSSLGDENGPWRAGVKRIIDLKDYQAVIDIGKGAGTRMQGLFILSELDRLGVIRDYPHMTYQQENWDNSENIGPMQIEIMNFVKANAAYLEFGYHGVGHEFWDENGQRTRAEYYNTDENTPRPKELMNLNLDVFENIMAQYGLSRSDGHSFPEVFVPPAYGYYWNPDSDYSTGSIMAERGLKYVNTNFAYISELNPPGEGSGGFDNGVLVVDRQNFGNPWYEYNSFPTSPIGSYSTEVIETHFPNLLAQDDFLQPQVTQKWVDFYQEVQNHKDHYVAKNTEQFYSQWLYRRFAKVSESRTGVVRIDNSAMPQVVYDQDMLGNMVLTVPLTDGQHIRSATLDGKPVSVYFEDTGYGFVYLPILEQKNYEFRYEIGNRASDFHVWLDGTYNVYNVELSPNKTEITLKMYGTQDVKIKTDRTPRTLSTSNERLKVISYSYDQQTNILVAEISGHDIQGETGVLTITY